MPVQPPEPPKPPPPPPEGANKRDLQTYAIEARIYELQKSVYYWRIDVINLLKER